MVGYKIWIASEQQEISVRVCVIYDFFREFHTNFSGADFCYLRCSGVLKTSAKDRCLGVSWSPNC